MLLWARQKKFTVLRLSVLWRHLESTRPCAYNDAMRALYFDGKSIKMTDAAVPVPAPGEALVRVLAAGVCRTDLEIARGYMSFAGILGHEFAGVVEECEDGSWIGRRVVGEINAFCGLCSYCREGLSRHCPNRSVLGIFQRDGAFAEFLSLPMTNLHELPEGLAPEAAVFVEPVAACYEIIEQVKVSGVRVAVIGDGKLGLLAARVLSAEGAEVVVAGRHAEKLELVQGPRVRTMMTEELVRTASDPEAKFPVVVEASGRAEGIRSALEVVRPRGVIVQKTTVAGTSELDLSRVVVDEITIVGSRCGPFEPAIRAIAEGRVRVLDLVSKVFPLAEGPAAVEYAMRPGVLKVLLRVAEK